MEPPNNNKTKTNWLHRLKHLKIRRTSSELNSSNDGEVVIRRSLPTNTSETRTRTTRSSFRKSLEKMHIRMKTQFFRPRTRNMSARHTIHVTDNHLHPSSSNVSSRITLQSPSLHLENIYSLDPVKGEVGNNEYVAAPDLPERRPRHRTLLTLPESPSSSPVHSRGVPSQEIISLSSCYWYWGPLSRVEAEGRLRGSPDGTFLVRDSSSTSYLFTISFRSVGKTLHSRIEFNRGRYSLFDKEGYDTVTELIEKAIFISASGIYCYSWNRDNNPNFPVRLTKPISRYINVRSLKYLCRFVIRQCTNINDIPQLPLPPLVKSYLQQEGPYF